MKATLDWLSGFIDWLGVHKSAVLAVVSAVAMILTGNTLPGVAMLLKAVAALFGATALVALSNQVSANSTALGLVAADLAANTDLTTRAMQHAHVTNLRTKAIASGILRPAAGYSRPKGTDWLVEQGSGPAAAEPRPLGVPVKPEEYIAPNDDDATPPLYGKRRC